MGENSVLLKKRNQLNLDSPLEAVIIKMGDGDETVRFSARQRLLDQGCSAVRPLARLLKSSSEAQIRWAAARGLSLLPAAAAVTELVDALEDSDKEVAWAAANALVHVQDEAWLPLLKALTQRSNSPALRRGAHRVLMAQQGIQVAPWIKKVLSALDSPTPGEAAGFAAYEAIEYLKKFVH